VNNTNLHPISYCF